jgi:hypothetical protein
LEQTAQPLNTGQIGDVPSGDRYGKWTMYFDLDSNQPINVILDEIGMDPTCVFWG